MKWDGTIGPASIISFIGALAVLVTMGINWGSFTSKIEVTAQLANEARLATAKIADSSVLRDRRVAEQAERLGKIETSVQFIVPALQRIEQKLDAPKQ